MPGIHAAGVIGMGVAADVALRDMDARLKHSKGLKERLVKGLKNHIEGPWRGWS